MAGTLTPGMVPSSAQIPPVGAELPPMFAWGAPATYADLQLAATGFLQPQQGAAESRHRIWLRAFWNVLHWRFRLWLILIALPLAWVADWCFNKLRSLGVERSRAIVCAGIFAIVFPPLSVGFVVVVVVAADHLSSSIFRPAHVYSVEFDLRLSAFSAVLTRVSHLVNCRGTS